MELTRLTINDFNALLASDAPAPGGGSAAALAGALGVSLTAMVCALTKGRKKYADDQELILATEEKAQQLRRELTAAIEKDTEAFNSFSAALALPKATDEEKNIRSSAMQEALIGCIESPLHIMKLSGAALELTQGIFGHSNVSAASDLAVSAILLKAAAHGAWLNVRINLSSLKDSEKAERYSKEGKALLEQIASASDALCAAIEETL